MRGATGNIVYLYVECYEFASVHVRDVLSVSCGRVASSAAMYLRSNGNRTSFLCAGDSEANRNLAFAVRG